MKSPTWRAASGRAGLAFAALILLAAWGTRAGAAEERDPLEGVNRRIFWFNDKLDVYFLEPVAKGWDFVLPDVVQNGIYNVFDNADFPLVLVNGLLQGEPRQAAIATGRFVVNSTIGLAGFFDPAKRWGLKRQVRDFGQTFGRWGIPAGPYLVFPLLGPSTVREGVGLVGDSASRVYRYFTPFSVGVALTATETVNIRARYLEDVRSAKRASLDYYVFIRNAYLQRRNALIRGERAAESIYESGAEADEDLYEIEDEE